MHNVRSTHNVGSIFRTANGFGINHIYLTGYTPYPKHDNDERLPHMSTKINNQIHKTALGAENSTPWSHINDLRKLVNNLVKDRYLIAALEQSSKSIPLNTYKQNGNVALIIGNEVKGIDSDTLRLAKICLEIPMSGDKESFNVASATAIALYQLTFNVSN